MRQLKHDGFARYTLYREQQYVGAYHGGCSNCGNNRKNGFLFRYLIKADDSLAGKRNEIKGLFCSIGCMRAYHGE